MGLDELLAPAERYAREGFVATDVTARYFALNEALLASDRDASAIFLSRGAPAAGTKLSNPALADTLAAIRAHGARAFYEGRIASAICETLNALGNPMTQDDLLAQTTERMEAVRVPWHAYELCAHPPNSQAAIAPMVLGALQHDGDASDEDWTHFAIEAIKEAFEARNSRFGEPASMPAHGIDDLLTPQAFAAMRSRIDPARARAIAPRTNPGGTIAIVAVDADGRAVSLIESLYMNFGSGIVARGTGIFLQNRGTYFTLEEGHPNELGRANVRCTRSHRA